MVKKHRFHIKIDSILLEEIEKFCLRYNVKTKDRAINYVFDAMLPLLEEIETVSEDVTIHDEATDFENHLIIKLKPEYLNRLKYLHFRFKTLSMATILRKVLRVYLILSNPIIADILSRLEEYQKHRWGYSVNFDAHMCRKKDGIMRILTMDKYYYLINLTYISPRQSKLEKNKNISVEKTHFPALMKTEYEKLI